MAIRPHSAIHRWRAALTDRPGVTPVAVTLVLAGLFDRGFDDALGRSIECALCSVAALLVLAAVPVPRAFWRGHARPLLMIAAAMGWLVVVQIVRLRQATGPASMPIAPDLFAARFLGALAGGWALVVGLLLGRRAGGDGGPQRWLLMLVTGHAACGLALFALPDNPWPTIDTMWLGRFAGLIGNANVTAVVCGVGCILAWGEGLRIAMAGRVGVAESVAIGLCAVALAINAVALILGASRTVTVCVAFALVVLMWPRRGDDRRRLGMAALALLVAVGGMAVLARPLVDRWTALPGDGAVRSALWGRFAQLVPGAWATGYGPGALPTAQAFAATDATRYSAWSVNSPHQIVLQLLLVGGLPYALLLVAAAAGMARDAMRGYRRWAVDRRTCALLLSLAVIAIDAAVDIVLDVPVGYALAALLAGLAWQTTARIANPANLPVPIAPRRQSRRPAQRPNTAA